MNRKYLTVLVITALVAIVLAVFYFFYEDKKQDSPENVVPAVVKSDVAPGQIASGFPIDLLIEPGSETKQSYEAVAKDGRKQSTLSTTTTKTPEKALEDYIEFFTSKGWALVNVPNVDTTESTAQEKLMRRADDVLQISVSEDLTTKKRIVSLSLTEAPKK